MSLPQHSGCPAADLMQHLSASDPLLAFLQLCSLLGGLTLAGAPINRLPAREVGMGQNEDEPGYSPIPSLLLSRV